MKKIISTLLVCVLVLGSVFAFASCSKKLSGAYSDKLGLTTLDFSGSKVTFTVKVAGVSTTANAKYAIDKNEDDKYKITFTFDDGEKEPSGFSGALPFEEVDNKTIKIAGVTYSKAK